MLKILRKKGVAKKVLWFVAIIIIISFGFLGTAYLITGQTGITTAGTIFGRDVTFPAYEKAYRDVRIQALIYQGERFQQYINTRDLDADTWDRLIILYEAKRRRIRVSDDEVIGIIQKYPFFQRDGMFDNLLYREIVQYIFKVPARSFEEIIRDSLKISKLFAQETFTASVEEEEIREAYNTQNEKVQVSYVFIAPEQFINEAAYDQEKAREYYSQNASEFTIPQSINVDYVHIPYADDSFPDEGDTPQALEAVKQARERAEKIVQELADEPDLTFEDAAKNNQTEVKSSGFFSMEKPNLSLGMSYELLKNLFEMRKDELTKPVETSNGFFIVKVTEKKRSYVPDYEEALEAVKETILRQNAMANAQTQAEKILPQLKEEYNKVLPLDFVKAAKALSLEIDQTPVFNRGQYLPKIGISKDFQEAAFSLNKENPISDVIATPNGYCIIHLDEYIPADDEGYEQQKDQIAAILLNSKRIDIFEEFKSRLRLESNLIDNISKLKEDQN